MENLKQLEIEIRTAFAQIRTKPFEAEQHIINALRYFYNVSEASENYYNKAIDDILNNGELVISFMDRKLIENMKK